MGSPHTPKPQPNPGAPRGLRVRRFVAPPPRKCRESRSCAGRKAPDASFERELRADRRGSEGAPDTSFKRELRADRRGAVAPAGRRRAAPPGSRRPALAFTKETDRSLLSPARPSRATWARRSSSRISFPARELQRAPAAPSHVGHAKRDRTVAFLKSPQSAIHGRGTAPAFEDFTGLARHHLLPSLRGIAPGSPQAPSTAWPSERSIVQLAPPPPDILAPTARPCRAARGRGVRETRGRRVSVEGSRLRPCAYQSQRTDMRLARRAGPEAGEDAD